jgi:hypothetical protein
MKELATTWTAQLDISPLTIHFDDANEPTATMMDRSTVDLAKKNGNQTFEPL